MLRPGKLYVNTTLRLTINFKDDDGDDVDPSTVTFRLMSPGGVESTYVHGADSEVTKQSVGDYAAEIVPDTAGRWFYRWQTTGSGTALATEGDFLIQDSPFFDGVFTDYI